MRGIPSIVEHYYQEDAYYSFSEQAGDTFTLRKQSYGRKAARTWARVDAAVAGNATLDPQQVHVLYQAFRSSNYNIDDGIAGSRFMGRMRLGRTKLLGRDKCDPKHPEGCIVREREGGGAAAVPWDATRLLGLVQGQMGQLAIHRARPDGDAGGIVPVSTCACWRSLRHCCSSATACASTLRATTERALTWRRCSRATSRTQPQP